MITRATMNPARILEIAHQYGHAELPRPDIAHWQFTQADLLAFAGALIEEERQRLQPVVEALQSCSDAMDYMSEYDIPINLPFRVSEALKTAKGESP